MRVFTALAYFGNGEPEKTEVYTWVGFDKDIEEIMKDAICVFPEAKHIHLIEHKQSLAYPSESTRKDKKCTCGYSLLHSDKVDMLRGHTEECGMVVGD